MGLRTPLVVTCYQLRSDNRFLINTNHIQLISSQYLDPELRYGTNWPLIAINWLLNPNWILIRCLRSFGHRPPWQLAKFWDEWPNITNIGSSHWFLYSTRNVAKYVKKLFVYYYSLLNVLPSFGYLAIGHRGHQWNFISTSYLVKCRSWVLKCNLSIILHTKSQFSFPVQFVWPSTSLSITVLELCDPPFCIGPCVCLFFASRAGSLTGPELICQ